MKRVLRSFAVGLLVGGLIGLWSGMNIGKGQPLMSNPFADVALGQQASRAANDVYEGASYATAQFGETVRSAGGKVEGAVEDATR